MNSYTLFVIATLFIAVSSSPTPEAAKNNPKRQIGFETESSTPPCSLSVYRYLYNKPGTKIRPNLPVGTVIFGRALPPLSPQDKLEESGSRIDAAEPIKPDQSSASDINAGYLPPDNNYLPPAGNPSYPPFGSATAATEKKPFFIGGNLPLGVTPGPFEKRLVFSSISPSATPGAPIENKPNFYFPSSPSLGVTSSPFVKNVYYSPSSPSLGVTSSPFVKNVYYSPSSPAVTPVPFDQKVYYSTISPSPGVTVAPLDRKIYSSISPSVTPEVDDNKLDSDSSSPSSPSSEVTPAPFGQRIIYSSISPSVTPAAAAKKPNYFPPFGITPRPEVVSPGSAASATDDAIIVSSTPGPEPAPGSSTFAPDYESGSSTLNPGLPSVSPTYEPSFPPVSSTFGPDLPPVSSTFEPGLFPASPTFEPAFSPDFSGVVSSTPQPISDEQFASPSPSPLPGFGPSPIPDGSDFAAQGVGFPSGVGGTRCTCEDGRVFFTPNGSQQDLNFVPSYFDVSKNQLNNELASRSQVLVSSTAKPFSSPRPIVVGNVDHKILNENSLDFSFPTAKPFVPSSTPAPVIVSSTPAPVVVSSTPVVPQPPALRVDAAPNFGPSFFEQSQTLLKYPFPAPGPASLPPHFNANLLYPQQFANYPLVSANALPPLVETRPFPQPPPAKAGPGFNVFPQQLFSFPIPSPPQPQPPSQLIKFNPSAVSLLKYPSPPPAPVVAANYDFPKPQAPVVPSSPSPPPQDEGYVYPKPSIPFPQPSYPTPQPPPTQEPNFQYPQPSFPPPPPPSTPQPEPGDGYSYPKPSIPFPPPPETGDSGDGSSSGGGYNYPKPKTPFSLPSNRFAADSDGGSAGNGDNLLVLKV